MKVNRLNKVTMFKFEGKCIVSGIHAQCIFSAMIHDVPDTSSSTVSKSVKIGDIVKIGPFHIEGNISINVEQN